jgi:hypothetical protein
MVCCGLIKAQGLERTQDMHNGSLAPRSHILAAGVTRHAPLLFRPRRPHTLARTRPFLEAVRPPIGRPRGDRTDPFAATTLKQTLIQRSQVTHTHNRAMRSFTYTRQTMSVDGHTQTSTHRAITRFTALGHIHSRERNRCFARSGTQRPWREAVRGRQLAHQAVEFDIL